jgi:hypothetical protein
MRVTKLIKDYVEKTVKEKMPTPEKPVNTLQEEYNALIDSLEAYCRNSVKDFLRKHGGEFYFSYSGFGADEIEKQIAYADRKISLYYPNVKTLAEEDYEKLCKEMIKKRNATINEILVSLELGANRAELEEMLSKIG